MVTSYRCPTVVLDSSEPLMSDAFPNLSFGFLEHPTWVGTFFCLCLVHVGICLWRSEHAYDIIALLFLYLSSVKLMFPSCIS